MQENVVVNTSHQAKQEIVFEKIIDRLKAMDDIAANRAVDFQEIRKKLVGGNTAMQEVEEPTEECHLPVIEHYLNRIENSFESMMETVKDFKRIV